MGSRRADLSLVFYISVVDHSLKGGQQRWSIVIMYDCSAVGGHPKRETASCVRIKRRPGSVDRQLSANYLALLLPF